MKGDDTVSTSDEPKETFEGWSILELMGHRRLGGYVKEVEIAGAGMLRIDIPGEPPATQFYSPAALYALTPTTEEVARAVALRSRPEPVQRWELPERIVALPREEDEYDPMRDADDDDDPGF